MSRTKIQTGDVLEASINRIPIISHYGFAMVNELGEINVMHNSPNVKNEFGGNLMIDSLDKWTETRCLTDRTPTRLTAADLEKAYEKYKYARFNLFAWNCEHFIWQVRDGNSKSPQLSYWVNIALMLIFVVVPILTRTGRRVYLVTRRIIK